MKVHVVGYQSCDFKDGDGHSVFGVFFFCVLLFFFFFFFFEV